MKLFIRTVDGANIPGGRALVLCDEAGTLLPQQIAVDLSQQEGEHIVCTVSFQVDGRDVVLDGALVEGDGE